MGWLKRRIIEDMEPKEEPPMGTYIAKCDICGTENVVANYGDWACRQCLQGYEYDECHRITLTDAQLSLLRNPPQWIPVTGRLPALHEHVIGWRQGWANAAEVWRGSKGQWLGGDFEPADEVTHWMPLPPPPTASK